MHTDGAARSNPGPAAFAYTIERPGDSTVEEHGCLGDTTNNIAEYTALVRALEHAQRLGGRRLSVHSDSELMIKQMNGEYKVKHPGLLPLYREAQLLTSRFEDVRFHHVRRETNKRADELCNLALDGPSSPKPSAAKSKSSKKAVPGAKAEAVRRQAVDCLLTAASAWARGDPLDPPADAVWDQLWDLLREEGVIK